jgi:hypothetical protein
MSIPLENLEWIRKEEIEMTEDEKRILPLQKELNSIVDKDILELTKKILIAAPKYFWRIPASSTGKYHPKLSLGDGGLVRHVKACINICKEFFGNETILSIYFDRELKQKGKDIIIAALLLHDICKSGIEDVEQQYGCAEHPLLVRTLCRVKKIDGGSILEYILQLIETHMGQWNTEYKTKQEILKKPFSNAQKFVHTIDYMASRKILDGEIE